MSIRTPFGKVVLYLMLEVGALCGVPMRPDQIEQLMNVNQQKWTQVLRSEGEGKPLTEND